MGVCGLVIDKKEYDVQKKEDELMTFAEPAMFAGRESTEIKHIRAFENNCLLVAQHTNINPKDLTVYEFVNIIINHGTKPNKSK